jgi:hypothetical protein
MKLLLPVIWPPATGLQLADTRLFFPPALRKGASEAARCPTGRGHGRTGNKLRELLILSVFFILKYC